MFYTKYKQFSYFINSVQWKHLYRNLSNSKYTFVQFVKIINTTVTYNIYTMYKHHFLSKRYQRNSKNNLFGTKRRWVVRGECLDHDRVFIEVLRVGSRADGRVGPLDAFLSDGAMPRQRLSCWTQQTVYTRALSEVNREREYSVCGKVVEWIQHAQGRRD